MAHPIEIGELLPHLRDLLGMEGNLTGLTARVIYIQNPLEMTFPTMAGGAGDGGGMKGVSLKQGTTQHILQWGKLGEELG